MKSLKSLYVYVSQKPRYIAVVSLIMIFFIGWFDYVTGYELGLSPLYFLPIALVAWNMRLLYGIFAGILSALMWYLAERLAQVNIANHFIIIWNSGIRLIIFIMIAYTIWLISVGRRRQKELVDFIIHDLRAPLTNVSGGLHLLRDYATERLDSEQRDVLAASLVSCDRANTLVSSILDISRFEAGKMELEMNIEPIKEIVDLSLVEVSAWAKRNRVSVQASYHSQHKSVYTDKGLLLRIMVNLLSNAIKASPPESIIKVRLFDYDETHIGISVHDEGPGIPENMKDKIFDKFAQLKARKGGFFVGSGIGLTFCRDRKSVV